MSVDDLLDGLPSDRRAARESLVRALLAAGASEEELRAAHQQDRLLMLPLERVLARGGTLTLEEVADAHGVPVDELVAVRRALGLPVRPGEAAYGLEVDASARRLRQARDAGVALDELLEIDRVIGHATAAIAAAARDVMRGLLAAEEPDETRRALRAAESATALGPVLQEVCSATLGEHLRILLSREAAASFLLDPEHDAVREVAVGFADLVGFTGLGEGAAPAQVGRLARRLEELADGAREEQVELVKTLGDGVMLASADPTALVRSLRGLVAAVDADPQLPPARAGAAHGPAVTRAGDWFGAVVNLAARLVHVAEPGGLALEAALCEVPGVRACSGELAALGPVAVRGLSHPVEVHVARVAA